MNFEEYQSEASKTALYPRRLYNLEYPTLGLTGDEVFAIRGLAKLAPKAVLEVEAKRPGGEIVRFKAVARVDDPVDLDYLRHGGVLPLVFRELAARN